MDVRPSRWTMIASALFVFVIAVAVRLPSCYQSFWVDELHSAWCVWDSLIDVAPRAKLGNQAPFYFDALWFWKQAFGGGEMALRMSSVLLTSIAATVMTVGISRWTGSRIAGVAAGLVMALESNAIFFGTELRPYAVVILCASIATLCFVRLLESEQSQLAWNVLAVSVLVALAIQPTSFGVLSWFPLVIGLRRVWNRRLVPRLNLSNILLVIAFVAVVWTLWNTTLGLSWRDRGNWATFAKAGDFGDAVTIWDWTWLWALPLMFGLFSPRHRNALLSIGLIAAVSTFAFWAASRLDLVHLWHRRYFVAVLPMFAVLVGVAVAQCGLAMQGGLAVLGGPARRGRARHGRLPGNLFAERGASIVAMTLLLLGLTWSQSVLQTVFRRPDFLAYRGEDWRSAIGWVQREQNRGDMIWLDPGLIESRILSHGRTKGPAPTSDQLNYLRYPVSGPYRLQDVLLIPPIGSRSSIRDNVDVGQSLNEFQSGSLWIVSRASGETALQFAEKLKHQENTVSRSDNTAPSIRTFGGVSVVRFGRGDFVPNP